MPNALGTINPTTLATVSMMPPDPRYGYTEQTAAPSPADYTRSGTNGTYGQSYTGTGTIPGGGTPASTNFFYHTLGYINDSAENWDYLVFNDRDFSSVAELLLVPGCPPGLFTKQFVEFAASQQTAANIFSRRDAVVRAEIPGGLHEHAGPARDDLFPLAIHDGDRAVPGRLECRGQQRRGSQSTGLPSPNGTTSAQYTANNPMLSFATGGSGITSPYAQPTVTNNTPVLPHAFPYLVDKFFYTGASTFYYPPNGGALDPGSVNSTSSVPVVGGPGGDGWFKMLEFFEVPSQSIGSTGPVAAGANFDWARQDIKPGLMNLNLIIDEEAFYAVFGRQNATSYSQNLLNSIQLPLLATYHQNTGQLTLPYNMPLVNNNYFGTVNTTGNPPIQQGGPPVPLVVSAIQPTGAPNYAYPVTDQTQLVQHGYLANDPIIEQLQIASGNTLPMPGIVGNRIKAAFAQFLWRGTAGRATCSATAPATPGRTAPSPRRG